MTDIDKEILKFAGICKHHFPIPSYYDMPADIHHCIHCGIDIQNAWPDPTIDLNFLFKEVVPKLREDYPLDSITFEYKGDVIVCHIAVSDKDDCNDVGLTETEALKQAIVKAIRRDE